MNEGKEEGVRYGVAKLVKTDGALVAYVPFSENEDLDKNLADGTKFTFKHGMIIETLQEENTVKLTKILQEGK